MDRPKINTAFFYVRNAVKTEQHIPIRSKTLPATLYIVQNYQLCFTIQEHELKGGKTELLSMFHQSHFCQCFINHISIFSFKWYYFQPYSKSTQFYIESLFSYIEINYSTKFDETFIKFVTKWSKQIIPIHLTVD